MTAPCDRVRAEAPGLASLPPEHPERVAAWAHARGCAECARALREAERLQVLLAEARPELLPAGALERASRAIAGELRREGRRRSLWAATASGAAVAAIVAFARHVSGTPADFALGAFLAAVALGLAAAASRRPTLAAACAAGAALLAAAAAGRAGPLAADEGVRCLAAELVSAALVVGAGWLALRGGTTSPSRSALAAAAAAGALAGDAALQVTCSAHEAMPHLLAFHVGGVLLAASAAALLPRRAARATA
ncbi:MAG TPA: hypothetical protein VIW03_08970 [Anaeromyxobacter sp.]